MERKYRSPADYLKAAKSPATSVGELEVLAQVDYDFVRLAVVQNPKATSSILRLACPDEFDTWNRQHIAGEIGQNTMTPHDTLRKIAEGLIPFLNNGRGNDMAAEAAVRFCNNSETPLEFVKIIVCDKNVAIGIRQRIASRISRKDVLEILLNDVSEAVQKRAASNLTNRGHL
jgi:hypothetical protein